MDNEDYSDKVTDAVYASFQAMELDIQKNVDIAENLHDLLEKFFKNESIKK